MTEAERVLKGLLKSLEELHAQRVAGHSRRVSPIEYARRSGELWGLGVAISAVKRRLK